MGQSESSFRDTYAQTVSQLSTVQLSEIHARFEELYAKAGGSKGVVVDREAFSNYLNLPVTVGDRLFDAFDKKNNGSICVEEFVCGLAIVLHGSFKDRCALLFSVFNLGNDEGVSRAELRTMLTAILQSTNTILYTVGHQDSAVMGSQDMNATIDAMVESAFTNCDISRTGKLLPKEFEYWLKRNPKVLDSLLSFQTRSEECTLGQLIMSPSEQMIGGMAASSSSTPQSSLSSISSTPVQTQKKRSPFSIRRLSKDSKGKESSSLPPPKMFQVGSASSMSTQEGSSVTSDMLHSVAMDSGPSAVADPQLDSLSSLTPGFEVGSEPGSEQCSLSGLPLPIVSQATSDVSLNNYFESGEEQQAAKEVSGGSGSGGPPYSANRSNVSLEMEDGDSAAMDSSTGTMQETDLGLTAASGVSVEAQLLPSSSLGEGVGGVAHGQSVTSDGTSPSQVALNLEDVSQEVVEQSVLGGGKSGLEGGAIVYDGVNVEGGAGSIMNADSSLALALDLDQVPQVQDQGINEPFSPILPTTQLEVGMEEKEEWEEGVEVTAVSAAAEGSAPTGDGMEPGPASLSHQNSAQDGMEPGLTRVSHQSSIQDGMEPGPAPLSRQSSAQDDIVQSPPAAFTQLDRPLLGLPVGGAFKPRPSGACVLVDEGEVKEDIYQAWVLHKVTRSLLEGQPPDDGRGGGGLTCPALMSDIKMTDGISELLSQHYPDRPRMQLLSVEQVSMDAGGLRRLVSSGSLFAALELTSRFLSAHGQGLGQVGQPTIHTHKTLQMWSARISLLFFLRLYHEAERELDAFGEMLNPDLYYQFHNKAYPGRKGSMVPFTLRLLHANLPRHTNKVQLALDRLCNLQGTCKQVLQEIQSMRRLPDHEEQLSDDEYQVAVKVWRERLKRVKSCLGNTLVHLQDYSMAAKIYNELAEEDEEKRCELLSVIGRLYLQLGDLRTAQQYFNKVKGHLGDQAEVTPLVHMNEGFASVFLSQWQTAMDHFMTALSLDPSDITAQSNVTVCKFYMGQLKESVRDMEALLTLAPPTTLQPAVFANLSNSYELESGNSFNKKMSFLPLLGQYVGQGYQHLNHLNLR